MSYKRNPNDDRLDLLDQNHYYPFGLRHRGYDELGSMRTIHTNGYLKNHYKYNNKELQTELNLNLYDYGARNYNPTIGRWFSVDPLAEQTMEPYLYAGNNPIRYTDPTGMAKDDIIDLNKNTGGIKITKAKGADVVRLVDNGKVVDSYEYGENGSFMKENKVERDGLFERTGYKVHFQDAKKAEEFFKLAAKSDVEFASMNFFFGDNVTGQSTVLTNGSSQSVRGTAYEVLRKNPDAYLLNFSHSHPGKYNPKTNYPAAPSGFNYSDLKPNNYNGDRQRYIEGNNEFGNRIPNTFNIYIPGNPNLKVKHNGQKATRTIIR